MVRDSNCWVSIWFEDGTFESVSTGSENFVEKDVKIFDERGGDFSAWWDRYG